MFRIAIPTYDRCDNFKTIKFLEDNNVSPDLIDIFVANENERDKYILKNGTKYNFIVGELGIMNQRNFITDYYPENQIIVSMDDDIENLIHKSGKSFSEWLPECIDYINNNDIGLLGIPPSSNKFFFDQNTSDVSFKQGNYLCVGVFHIFKNIKSIKLNIDFVEDYQKSIEYIKIFGKNARYMDIFLKTKYWNKKGGLASQRNKDTYNNMIYKFIYNYSKYISFNYKIIKELDKYNELPNLKIKQNYDVSPSKIIQFPKIPASEFSELYCMLENINIPKKHKSTNRRGFPLGHQATTFGYTRGRFNGKYDISAMSKKHPEIYNEILRIGNIYCPLKYKSIHVNRNVVTPPHKDSRNVGQSMLVSFGDYTGCKIVVDNETYDAELQPIIFDGATYEHWNTDDLVGTKYSLVYFCGEMSDR